MPRVNGIFTPPSGTKGTPNTTIQSAKYNALVDDLTADANAARPVTAGGTGATSASGARTALGVNPGTDVQAYNALLQAISGLTTSASGNQIIYTTGTNAVALTTLSAYGRSLIDDANAAAARTTLGLGTAAVADVGTSGANVPYLNGNNTWSGSNEFTGNLISSSASGGGRLQLLSPTTDARLDANASTNDFRVRNASNTSMLTLDLATGNLSLAGFLALNSGGTGATNAASARDNLNVPSRAITITAGNGLRGGGTLADNRTLAIDLGSLPAVSSLGAPRVVVTDGTTTGSEARMVASDFRSVFGFGGLATMDIGDLVYNGTSTGNTTFPVGSYVAASRSSNYNRNASVSVWTASGNTQLYTLGSGDSQLGGTWRYHGPTSSSDALMRRTS